MKKIRHILYIVCVLCAFSCAEDKIPSGGQLADRPYYLTVEKSALSFGASQNLVDFVDINSKNVSWEITGAPDWLTLSVTSGTGTAAGTSAVKVTASENRKVDEARSALLTVRSTSPGYQFQKTIAVSQAAASAYIKVDKTSLSFAPQAVAATVAVDANIEWEAVTEAAWLTLSRNGSAALQVAAIENVTAASRTATVTLRRVGTTAALSTLSVVQSEGGVTGSTEEIAFGFDGGTRNVEIDADVTWSAVPSASWLAVTPERGTAGKAELKITALANNSTSKRNGFVYVKIGTTQKLSIPVSQEAIGFDVSGSLQEFTATGGEAQKLTVVSDKEWKVLSCPGWLTVTPAEGSKGTADVTVKAAENRSLNSRSATLRIGIEGLSVYKDVTVVQSGLDSEFGGSTLEFPWETSQKEIEIVVPGSWSAMVSGDWFSLSQYSGNGGEKVYVTVQTNDNEDARNGTLTIVTEGRTLSLSVVQQGQYLKISSTAGEVAAMGGSVNLSITTTVGAKDSIEYVGTASGWLSVAADSKGSYTLTAAYNPSINSREAQFVVMPTMSTTNNECTQGVRFAVTQKGRALSASTSDINMFKGGGTSATYTITADGSYSISKPGTDNWYVLQHDAEARTFYVVVSENTTDDARKSQLTISLGELPTGEEKSLVIDITQYAGGTNVDVGVDGWGNDEDWGRPNTGILNGYAWVDLDLPSGIKWATCNVGASSPEEYGDYYAWGETSTKSEYEDFNTNAPDGNISGKSQYDVACAKWGSTWRMPKYKEFEELLDENNCAWEWTTQNGVNGYKVTSKSNGASIFLPAAGYRLGTSLYTSGSGGYYWSSNRADLSSIGYYLHFGSSKYYLHSMYNGRGLTIRPVNDSE